MRGPLPGRIVADMMTNTVPLSSVADSQGWARVFAAIYDPFLWLGERAGMCRYRRELLTQARGRTLEIGSGTGLNLVHYPDDLDGLVLAEPDASMRKRLQATVRRSERPAHVIDARAEQLPFADASVDTVVSTLVLCTVDAPDIALREIRRVLRPGGQLLFIEHIRSESPRLARWQDRLARPWQRFAEGCRCNRATLELIEACAFDVTAHPAAWRAMPPIIRPLSIGRATIAARSASSGRDRCRMADESTRSSATVRSARGR
jgi:SAM-dependent methyltransferase